MEKLNADLAFQIGLRIEAWVEALSRPPSSNHFALRDPPISESTVRLRRQTLSSLMKVSKRFNELWSPIQLQDVTLWSEEIPSFLLLLFNHPDLGSQVRKISFLTRDANDEYDSSASVALDLLSLGHPRLKPEELLRNDFTIQELKRQKARPIARKAADTQRFINDVIAFARSLILEECKNLKDLNFNSHMTFPLYIQKGMKLVLSQELQRIKMIELDYDHQAEGFETPRLRGRNVLLLLLSLQNLKAAAFDFLFDSKDAELVLTNLSELSGEAGSKGMDVKSSIERLRLDIHLFPRKARNSFSLDQTFRTFFSIFDSLVDFNFEFFEARYGGVLLDSTSYDILKGLRKSNLFSITSLSILGINEFFQDDFISSEWQPRFLEIISLLKSFENLKYLRCGSSLLKMVTKGNPKFQALAWEGKSDSCPLPNGLESIEIGYNHQFVSGIFKATEWDLLHFVVGISENLPRTFKLFKTPRKPKLPGKSPAGAIDFHENFNYDEWDGARLAWHEACHKRGIVTEFM